MGIDRAFDAGLIGPGIQIKPSVRELQAAGQRAFIKPDAAGGEGEPAACAGDGQVQFLDGNIAQAKMGCGQMSRELLGGLQQGGGADFQVQSPGEEGVLQHVRHGAAHRGGSQLE